MTRKMSCFVLAAVLTLSWTVGASDFVLSGSYLDYILKRSAMVSSLNALHEITPPLVSVELIKRPAQEYPETAVIPYTISPRSAAPEECILLGTETVYGGTEVAIIGPSSAYVGVRSAYTLKAYTYLLDVERYNCWTTYRSFVVGETKLPESRIVSVVFDEPGPVTLKMTYTNTLGYPVTIEKEIEVHPMPFRSN